MKPLFIAKLIKPSTRAFFTEQASKDCRLSSRVHGYIYARWPYLYIGIGTGRHPLASILKSLWKIIVHGPGAKPRRSTSQAKINFAQEYHGKALPLNEARKLVKVSKSINLGDLEQVIPYTKARDLVLKNPDHIVALECPCRATSPDPCLPLDVCLIIGEPFASFIAEHHPRKSRRISQAEATAILEQEHDRGHVHHAFFKEAMLGRFYAICNCCSCCCGAIQAHQKGVPMLASSGFTARVQGDECVACRECVRSCQFRAISLTGHGPVVNTELCMGCGVCTAKCVNQCLSLVRNTGKCPPLELTRLIEGQKNRSCSVTIDNQIQRP
ncbi:4Fe-4S dicluster domain-containing protein [Desulfonatronovibrio hydrogenovorans]|uniref:4Fe-4S dicluster domain-containing protein n=1 Tax=Desulfonatronovibrio hydrogenovorans TaxID=53245 RepID=UPI00048D53AB|nr:4Fe-4S ferredoxin [Desulfonatronovibrio hydrogenovorans]